MLLRKGCLMAICFAFCWPLLTVSAEEDSLQPPESSDEGQVSWWLDSHESFSKTIGNWSTNMDSFLSGSQSSQQSDSNVQIRFGSVFNEDKSTGFFDFRTRLKLPNTQDRLRLIVESEPDSLAPESLRGESSQQNTLIDSALKSSVSAAVRYIEDDIGLDVDAGIRVDFPLDPFLRLRLKQGEVVDQWEWWQKQEAFAYYSKGIGARYGIGLGYVVTPTLDLGTDFGITWLDKEGLFYARENFFIQHQLDDSNRLRYQVSFLQSGEHELEPDSVLYNLQYERLLYKDWLIGQVIPQITHEADEDYEGKLSLTLSLAILLGPKYLH